MVFYASHFGNIRLTDAYYCLFSGKILIYLAFDGLAFSSCFSLDAKPLVRAKRRALDLGIPKEGEEFNKLLESINLRDKTDMERKIAPLKKAENAVYIDTSKASIKEVLAKVMVHYRQIRQTIGQ